MNFVLWLAGCAESEQKAVAEKISGAWELHQVETANGTLDGLRYLLQKYDMQADGPRCTWGRMTWTFSDDAIAVGVDVLCRAGEGDYQGCEVSTTVPATWNADLGQWTVPYPVAVRNRTASTTSADDGAETEAVGVATQCEVSVDAGTYVVERVRPPGGEWRWEMKAPQGVVLRLRLPRSDRPDFVSAIAEAEPAVVDAPPPPAPSPVPPSEQVSP